MSQLKTRAVPDRETVVSTPEDALFHLADGTAIQVISLRADATGGYFKTATDDKSQDYVAPSGKTIANYETKVISQAGDHSHNVSLISNTSIHADVHAKGHPRGEANNHSWIEIEVWVVLS